VAADVLGVKFWKKETGSKADKKKSEQKNQGWINKQDGWIKR